MVFDEAGTYQIEYTATDDCGNTTTAERTVIVEAPTVYGVVWDGSDNSQWTRTDLATLFTDPVPQMSDGNGGWTVGSSPFDDIMPWSGMEIVEDAEAGTLVKIPKFYYKWTRNGDAMKLQISPTIQEGFFTSPAHADRGDGVGERDYVYVGRYHCAGDYKSKTGSNPKRLTTRSSFRTAISALGNDVWQWDFAMYWTVCMLYLVEFANWNSQEKIGYGCGTATTIASEGATDAMTYHTGTNATSLTTYGEVQYRHIEGLWSNVLAFVDGIYFAGTDVNVINNPADFSDTVGGTNVGTRMASRGTIKSFTDPSAISGYEYALYGATDGGTNFTKYTCDMCAYSSSDVALSVGGSYNPHNQNVGLFHMYDTGAAFTDSSIGSRLMKLPS